MMEKLEGHTSSVIHTDERDDQQSHRIDERSAVCIGLADYQYDYVGHVRVYYERGLSSGNAQRLNLGEVP